MTTEEVRLDDGRLARSSGLVRATGGFDRLLRTSPAICCCRTSKGTILASEPPGIRGMSVNSLVIANSATTLIAVPLVFLLPRLIVSRKDAEIYRTTTKRP